LSKLQDHPVAELFDLATEAELDGLADDIAANGLIEPIELYEGKILDGRNRYRACLKAHVEPVSQQWKPNGIEPTAYVIAKNLHRRHLTIGQRAAVAVRLLDYERKEALKRKAEAGRSAAPGRPAEKDRPNADDLSKGRAAQRAAEKVGVGRTSVLAAELIARESPETFERLRRGELSVTAAASEAGVGTGTYAKKKPHKQFNADEVQALATPADNLHSAHFYTGLAVNVLSSFDLIPTGELNELIEKAEQARVWWGEIEETLRQQKGELS
jgi:ParB-like chromosome segregation protein Spo0J